jgi:hypothetical protein
MNNDCSLSYLSFISMSSNNPTMMIVEYHCRHAYVIWVNKHITLLIYVLLWFSSSFYLMSIEDNICFDLDQVFLSLLQFSLSLQMIRRTKISHHHCLNARNIRVGKQIHWICVFMREEKKRHLSIQKIVYVIERYMRKKKRIISILHQLISNNIVCIYNQSMPVRMSLLME